MSRRAMAVVALGLALGCAGCTGIPTTGQVESEPRRIVDDGQGSITVVPQPPPHGARPEMIITGFLTAMASYGSDYATAREYLTEVAAQQWSPESEVLIYASGTTPRAVGNQWILQGQRIGRIRSDGSFEAAQDTAWTHDFGMSLEDGEWRISHPPAGLALSQFMFAQSFTRVDAYFFADPRASLVPDTRYFARGAWDRTMAARLVLDGPSQWLAGIVDHSGYDAITIDGDVVLSAEGTAEVPLSVNARTLGLDVITDLAIEIAATMRDLPGVTSLRLMCEGEPLALGGAGADSALPLSITDALDFGRGGDPESLVWVRDGILYTSQSGTSGPLGGDWGVSPREVTALAMRADRVAAVTPEGLLMGVSSSSDPPVLHLLGEDLVTPQFTSRGDLWVATSAGTMVVFGGWGEPVSIDLDHGDIRGFRVSPDGYRILLITDVDPPGEMARQELSVALISYEGGEPVAITSPQSVRLTWEGAPITSIIDAAWAGPSSLLFLGNSGLNPTEIFITDVDGLVMAEVGYPQAWSPVHMATHQGGRTPQISVLDGDGTVWVYQEGYRWSLFAHGISAITYPV